MLTIGETFNSRKAFLWDYIHVCQDLIKAIQRCKLAKSTLAREVIAIERQSIRDTYEELKQLQRWFKTTDLKPDEPFYYKKKEGANVAT
jgi:hypothetical protein